MSRIHASTAPPRAAAPYVLGRPHGLPSSPPSSLSSSSSSREMQQPDAGVSNADNLSFKRTLACHKHPQGTAPPREQGQITPIRRGRSLSSSLRRLYHHFSSHHSSTTKSKVPPVQSIDSSLYTSHNSYSSARSTSPKRWFSTPSSSHLSLSSLSQSTSSPSSSPSLASSASSLVFPLDPEFEIELEIALEMAPHNLGSAWSHDSYNAMQYLRARTPYPPTMTDTAFDYHAQGDRRTAQTHDSGRWQSALEIGCGPGQMSIHLATHFAKVYGQDPSPNMLKLANTVKQMSEEELAEVRLPPVQDPERIEFSEARGEDPICLQAKKWT